MTKDSKYGGMKGYRQGGKVLSGGVNSQKSPPKFAFSGQASPGSMMSSGQVRHSLRGNKPSSSKGSVGVPKYSKDLKSFS